MSCTCRQKTNELVIVWSEAAYQFYTRNGNTGLHRSDSNQVHVSLINTPKEQPTFLIHSKTSKVSDLAFVMVTYVKLKFGNIQENWRHLEIK